MSRGYRGVTCATKEEQKCIVERKNQWAKKKKRSESWLYLQSQHPHTWKLFKILLTKYSLCTAVREGEGVKAKIRNKRRKLPMSKAI